MLKAEELGYHPTGCTWPANQRRYGSLVGRTGSARSRAATLLGCGYSDFGLGFTFKENCPDIRNTKVVDLIKGMERFGMDVHVVDPWADPVEVQRIRP